MGDLALERGHARRARDAYERLLEHHVVDHDAARVRAKLAACTPAPVNDLPSTIGGLRFTRSFAPSAPRPNRFMPRSARPPAGGVLAPCLPRVVGGRAFVVTADRVAAHDLRSGEDDRAITRLGPTHAEENVKLVFGAAVDEATLVVPFVDRIVHERVVRWVRPRATPIRKLAGFDLEGWRWTWNHASLLEGTPLATWSFPSPPVAVEGVVFASAFEDGPTSSIFVAAFDARTGARLWTQRVGSGVVEMTYDGERATEALCTPVAVWGGLVFHSTAFGWVTALDAMSGRPVWTSEYEVNETRTPPGFHPASLTLDWESNAPVVQSGVLLVAPMDSPRFYGFDARTGERLWSHRQHLRSALEPAKLLRVVMGTGEVSGQGVVVIGGGDEVRALDVRTGKLLWSAQLRGRAVAGRGCVAGGVVLVPVDRDEVFTFDLATGKRLGGFPVGATGNVTLAGEHVLVTGNGELAVHAAGP